MRLTDRIKALERAADPTSEWDRLMEDILPDRRAARFRAEIAAMEATDNPDAAALADLRAALADAEIDAAA